MRGSPPIQIFLLGLMFIVLAVPLSHLTGTTTPVRAAEVKKVEKETSVKGLLRVRYAHRPVTLSVKVGEKELIKGVEESPMEVDALLPSPKNGVDVFVKAMWPEGTADTAVTVELEPDGLATRSETRWSSAASLDEVITFEWK